jgi:ribosomal-protein-alanine N-acetyltransferase
MHHELHTRRLRLAPLHPKDGDDLYALSSDADVMRYSSLPVQTRVQTDEMLARWLAEMRDGRTCSWMLRDREDRFIGQASLFGIDRENHRAEIGYLLMPQAWGYGYATEAIAAVIRHAFGSLKLCRIEADVDPANVASWRALERNGFRREGFLPKRWFKDGRFYDAFFYGLLNERRIDELTR